MTAYSRAQKNNPYATQIASFLVIWLTGDLSTQLLFPPEVTLADESTPPERDGENTETYAPYDITRTLRHLTIGALAAVPTYRW